MATKIRLARAGSKKRPYYRIVVADSRSPRDGRFIERVGSYNPMLSKDDENRVELENDKIISWLDKGAVPTERVALFLDKAGIGNDNKVLKDIKAKRDNVIKIKKADIEAKKKKEAEEAKKKEAEAKAAAKAKAEEEKAAAKAEEEKAAE